MAAKKDANQASHVVMEVAVLDNVVMVIVCPQMPFAVMTVIPALPVKYAVTEIVFLKARNAVRMAPLANAVVADRVQMQTRQRLLPVRRNECFSLVNRNEEWGTCFSDLPVNTSSGFYAFFTHPDCCAFECKNSEESVAASLGLHAG